MLQLRPYQSDAKAKILKEFMTLDKTLVILPTGTGKTVLFTQIVMECAAAGKRSLVMVHRKELAKQAQDKLAAWGIESELEMGDSHASMDAKVVVASIQTWASRGNRFPADHFRLVVVDESHHSVSKQWMDVLTTFKNVKILGVTATPMRLDGKNLGEFYESIAYEMGLGQAIAEGHLCKVLVQCLPVQIKADNLKTTCGDYTLSSAASAIEPYFESIVTEWKKAAGNRKTLAFVPLISTSEKLVEVFTRHGVKAAHVDGLSTERDTILQAFTRGEIQVVVNSQLLTEGYDEPSIDCILPLRLTKSKGLYMQIVGRGTRLHPGKNDCLVLDFLYQTKGMIRPGHLISKTNDVADAAVKKSANGEAVDLQSLIDDCELCVEKEREEKLRTELAKRQKRQNMIYSLEDAAKRYQISMTNLVAGDGPPPSEKQLRFLRSQKIDVSRVTTRGVAGTLITRILQRLARK